MIDVLQEQNSGFGVFAKIPGTSCKKAGMGRAIERTCIPTVKDETLQSFPPFDMASKAV